MFKFRIWIDADSFPQKARNFTVQQAKSNQIPVIFVANHEIKNIIKYDGFEMKIVEKVQGAADDFIFENALDNDIVLTRDIPFAERLVGKKITVMNDRGVKFTDKNIRDRLSERAFSLNLSAIGLGGNKGSFYSEKEFSRFSSELEREVMNHKMIETYNIKKYDF